MRFQSGFSDQQRDQNPDAKRKPRLAVTTRTLEALIRLATAHAKLRLRRLEVLPEDVQEAYKLMLVAREEEVPEPPAAPHAEAAPHDDNDGPPGADAEPRGQKRTREAEGAAAPIQPKRFDSLRTLVARAFAREVEPQIPLGVLLENVNAELAEGEPPFTHAEFTSGINRLEAENKVMNIVDTGVVMYVG